METKQNLLLCTDAYKGSHHKLYPRDTEATRFYIAPRAPISPQMREFVVFGFYYFIQKYLNPITIEDIEEAKKIWEHFNVLGKPYPFPVEQFKKLVGKPYPINIYGVNEGTVCREYNVPVAVIECTDPEYFWLPGFLETAFQRAIWYPSTVATISRNVKKVLKDFYIKTVDDDMLWTLNYKLHDFGSRGAATGEAAAIGGLAHLINFNGTDTMEAVLLGQRLYGMPAEELACSIPASEHSTVTTHGKTLADERNALLQMIEEYGDGLFSFVSDSYDFRRFVDQVWCDPEIIKIIRAKGGTPVVRPDSGDQILEPLYALKALEKTWGVTINKKGYKVLNGITVIQGDGMNPKTIKALYEAVIAEGFAANNLTIGMGGGLLQKLDRDTMKWSMKCYQVKRNGTWINVQKKPATQTDKTAWNPQNGLDLENWVCYYGTNELDLLFETEHDFRKIRERAA